MSNEVPEDVVAPENFKRAMKAFKKRLKLTRLDDESGLCHSSAVKSRGTGIVAVRPPETYPQSVWDKLVEMGKLQNTGNGLYEIQQNSKSH